MKPILLIAAALAFLLAPLPAAAAAEIARSGHPPKVIRDVYWRDGVPFVAVEEVLSALGLQGSWDSVAHVFRFKTPAGAAALSPDSSWLRLDDRLIELDHPPRFIDGQLRVSEKFITGELPELLGEPVFFRDLDPPQAPPAAREEQSPLDKLFAFLLRRKEPEPQGPALRGVAIDPGHGGQDPGALSLEGDQEKTVVLEVAKRLQKLLKMRLAVPVHLSRDGDYALTPGQRLQAAARPDTDALLLIHAQAALGPSPRGVTLFVRPRDEGEGGKPVAGEGESIRLARHLEAAFRKNGFAVVGILRAPLPPLGRGDLPAVLVELGFLSNPEDRALLLSPEGRGRLAEALYAGLKSFADEKKETVQ